MKASLRQASNESVMEIGNGRKGSEVTVALPAMPFLRQMDPAGGEERSLHLYAASAPQRAKMVR